MGFEICYHFYPRKEVAGYDTDHPETFTKQLGKMEEVPLEKLANAILQQLARRDIMVFDVEIFEFTRRQISFKETKGGVLIKNKKFMLDGSIEVIEEEAEAPPPQSSIRVATNVPNNQALRFEVFDPDPTLIASLTRKYKLTPKRKYPVYEEKTVPTRIVVDGTPTETLSFEYATTDDSGQRIRVPSMHFVPEQKPLVGMEANRMTEQDYANQPVLMHMGSSRDNGMPVLRR